MTDRLKIALLVAFAVALLVASGSDAMAQFSGRNFGLRLPGGGAARGVAQQFLNRQGSNQPAYRQPAYSQPSCNRQPQPVYPPAYSQPVYSQPVYSQPVYAQPVAAKPQPKRALTPLELARKFTGEAKVLFQQGKYTQAAKKLDAVVKLAPKDTNAYQFRALANFARSDFNSAAADAYDALSLGNSWTKEVVQSIYGTNRMGTYSNQLGQLERVVNENPTMQSHFLLAYHCLVNGDWAQGKTQLEKVIALQPDEQLSKKLLAAVNSKLAEDNQDVAAN